MYPGTFDLIEISIHKPCTDNCGGSRIEFIIIEMPDDLALPIFEHIYI